MSMLQPVPTVNTDEDLVKKLIGNFNFHHVTKETIPASTDLRVCQLIQNMLNDNENFEIVDRTNKGKVMEVLEKGEETTYLINRQAVNALERLIARQEMGHNPRNPSDMECNCIIL